MGTEVKICFSHVRLDVLLDRDVSFALPSPLLTSRGALPHASPTTVTGTFAFVLGSGLPYLAVDLLGLVSAVGYVRVISVLPGSA